MNENVLKKRDAAERQNCKTIPGVDVLRATSTLRTSVNGFVIDKTLNASKSTSQNFTLWSESF